MVKHTPITYTNFLKRILPRFSGNSITKTRFQRYVAESFGTDLRTYKRNCSAMMMLGFISDGGSVWIIPHHLHKQLETEVLEVGGN